MAQTPFAIVCIALSQDTMSENHDSKTFNDMRFYFSNEQHHQVQSLQYANTDNPAD